MSDSSANYSSEPSTAAVPTGVDGAVGVDNAMVLGVREQALGGEALGVREQVLGPHVSESRASEAKWFVAIVNSRHEKAIAEKLQTLDTPKVESFVATQKEMRVWRNGKRKLIDRVVIPSMVFVKCTEVERRTIVTLPYINRFMVNRSGTTNGLNKPVAVISEAEMEKLKFMLGQMDRPVDFVSTVYNVKDTVRVVRGKFSGLTGEILTNSDGTHSLLVGIEMLGGAKMQIDPTDVEKIV